MPDLPIPPFTKHMTSHMAVVAMAAPLLALALAGGPADPVKRLARPLSAMTASMLELCAVWAWHAPWLHRAARHDLTARGLEQASFLITGFLLWMAALGGSHAQRRDRFVANTAGVLLTSMHMTLLGVLIATTPRVLYHPTETGDDGARATVHGCAEPRAPQAPVSPVLGAETAALPPLPRAQNRTLTDQQLGGAVMLLFGGVAYLLGGLSLCAEVLRSRPRKARS